MPVGTRTHTAVRGSSSRHSSRVHSSKSSAASAYRSSAASSTPTTRSHPPLTPATSLLQLRQSNNAYPLPRVSYLQKAQPESRPGLQTLTRVAAQGALSDTSPTFVTHATSTYATPVDASGLLSDFGSPEGPFFGRDRLSFRSSSSSSLSIRSSDTDPAFNLHLAHMIKAASSWPEIQLVCQQHSQSMQPHHLSTLITQLAQMQVRGQVPSLPGMARPGQQDAQSPADTSLHLKLKLIRKSKRSRTSRRAGKPLNPNSILYSSMNWSGYSTDDSSDSDSSDADAGSSGEESLPQVGYDASESQALYQLVQQIIPELRNGLHALRPRQVACVIWALAKLGHPDGRSFTAGRLLPKARSLLPSFDPQNLAMTAWALAAWQARGPPTASLDSCLPPTSSASSDGGSATLSSTSPSPSPSPRPSPDPFNPGPLWVSAFLDCCLTQLQLSAFTPRQLSNTLWALARLGIHPGTAVLHAFHTQAAAMVGRFNSVDVSSTLVALGVLSAHTDTQVPAELVSALVAQLIQELPLASDQSLANSLWALAALRTCPGHADMEKLFVALQPRARQLHPRALSQVLWACATLGVILPQEFVLEMLRATRGPVALAAFSPQSLSNILWALAAAGLGTALVADGWMSAFLTCVQGRLGEFSPQSISNLVTALCKLKFAAPPEWMSAAVNQLHRSRDPAGPQATANVLWALAKMGYSFNTQGLDAMVRLVARRLPVLLPSDSSSSSARTSMPHQGDQAEQSRACLHLRSLRFPPVFPPSPVFACVWLQVEPQLGAATPQEMANTMWALATLQAVVPDAWLLSAQAVFAPQLGSYSARDVAQLTYALARLGLQASSDLEPASRSAPPLLLHQHGHPAPSSHAGLRLRSMPRG
ncbi:MAG: hypothetical protein WDW36_003456 [Sanguina aurantia]